MLNDTIEKIDRFASEREWDQFHSPKNLAASISIEANELLEIFQWADLSRSEITENADKFREISEEIADVMIYCLRLCSTLKMEPISIINKKIEPNNNIGVFDIITARAFASIDKITKLTKTNCNKDTEYLLLKGKNKTIQEELTDIDKNLYLYEIIKLDTKTHERNMVLIKNNE